LNRDKNHKSQFGPSIYPNSILSIRPSKFGPSVHRKSRFWQSESATEISIRL
jgi:hypothetical protein